jgi:copper resistance protein B
MAAACLSVAGPVAAQHMDTHLAVFTLADQLEYNGTGTGRPVQWDVSAWVGTSYTRVAIRTEGGWNTLDSAAEFDLRAAYSRLISPFWELQAGARLEVSRRADGTDTRAHLAFGALGFAPYWFQLEPEVLIAQDGQVAVRLTAEYDLLLTQRLIAQPRFETYAAISENQAFGVGAGFNYVEPALRIRYEIRREFAPYLGLEWQRLLGDTARLAEADGQDAGELALLVGVRVWY